MPVVLSVGSLFGTGLVLYQSQPKIPEISPSLMATFFNVLTNVLVVASALAMILFIAKLIFAAGSMEATIRSMAAVTGFLIYVGAEAVGLSIPSLMLEAITVTNPFSIGAVGIVLPGLAGVVVAWFLLYAVNRGTEDKYWRLVVLISTFMVTLFGDVYAETLGGTQNNAITSRGLDLALLPNLAFTIGLSLYLIMFYTRKDRAA
jgi:hypothetical protein